MRKYRMLSALIILCLLVGGCQRSSVRNVVMQPDATAQPDQGMEDGTLTGIHSFPMEMTVEGENLGIQAWGWKDETHLWCEVYGKEGKNLGTVDDSYGFVQQVEGMQYQRLLGVSPDGRYVAFTRTADSDIQEDNVAAESSGGDVLMLYDAQQHESMEILAMAPDSVINASSLSFSDDGRTMSFIVDRQKKTYPEQQIHVYDMEGGVLRNFRLDSEIRERGYIYSLHITRMESIDEMDGWLMLYDRAWGGQCNALYIQLMDGKAFLAEMAEPAKDWAWNLQGAFSEVLYVQGLMMDGSWGMANHGIHWYDGAMLAQTADANLMAVDFNLGSARIVADDVRSVAIAPNGRRIAILTMSATGGAEIYTARVERSADAILSLVDLHLIYTGRRVWLGMWNQDGSKLLIGEMEEKEKTDYYRVLTLHTE